MTPSHSAGLLYEPLHYVFFIFPFMILFQKIKQVSRKISKIKIWFMFIWALLANFALRKLAVKVSEVSEKSQPFMPSYIFPLYLPIIIFQELFSILIFQILIFSKSIIWQKLVLIPGSFTNVSNLPFCKLILLWIYLRLCKAA